VGSFAPPLQTPPQDKFLKLSTPPQEWVVLLYTWPIEIWRSPLLPNMAGLGNDPVQVFSTLTDLHWEFLRLWTGFELSSSWTALPCYGAHRNRSGLDFMRWSQIDLGAQDLNDIQRPKSFQKNSWK
jgi:hypothetical protein